MKKNFLTGLVILLPIALTFWILMFLVNLLTNPFINTVNKIFSHYDLQGTSFLFFTGEDLLAGLARILILVALFGLLVIAGFLTRHFFLKPILNFGDTLIHRIPLINKIYKAAQDVVNTLFSEEKTSFSQVVLVPFPHSKSLCLGLVPGVGISTDSSVEYHDKVSIFVPGTPNPTMGFMLLYAKDQIIPTDMRVDDALKFIVSCGVIVDEKYKTKS